MGLAKISMQISSIVTLLFRLRSVAHDAEPQTPPLADPARKECERVKFVAQDGSRQCNALAKSKPVDDTSV